MGASPSSSLPVHSSLSEVERFKKTYEDYQKNLVPVEKIDDEAFVFTFKQSMACPTLFKSPFLGVFTQVDIPKNYPISSKLVYSAVCANLDLNFVTSSPDSRTICVRLSQSLKSLYDLEKTRKINVVPVNGYTFVTTEDLPANSEILFGSRDFFTPDSLLSKGCVGIHQLAGLIRYRDSQLCRDSPYDHEFDAKSDFLWKYLADFIGDGMTVSALRSMPLEHIDRTLGLLPEFTAPQKILSTEGNEEFVSLQNKPKDGVHKFLFYRENVSNIPRIPRQIDSSDNPPVFSTVMKEKFDIHRAHRFATQEVNELCSKYSS